MNVTYRPLAAWPYPDTKRRRSRYTFKAGWTSTMNLLAREIQLLGGHDVVIGAALREADIRQDGTPRSNAREPTHPGIEISFDTPKHGRPVYASDACDHSLWWVYGVQVGRIRRGDPGWAAHVALGKQVARRVAGVPGLREPAHRRRERRVGPRDRAEKESRMFRVAFPGPFQHHDVVVDGLKVPLITAQPSGENDENVMLIIDDRLAATFTVNEAERFVPFLADAIAVALGYTSHPDETTEDQPRKLPQPRPVRVHGIAGVSAD